MNTRTRPSVIVSIDDPPLPTYPDYDNAITPTRKPGMSHSEKKEENNKKKMSKLLIQPKAGYNDPKNLQSIKYAQLIAAEYDDYYRKYTIVRSADPEMPGNFMIDGDSRTYPSGKKYEGGLFIFLDSDFPGTSGAWDSWASITGGEYDNNGKQYALSLDMSSYGYYGVRISGEYGDITYFNFKLDSYDNDICKLFDHNGWPMLWYNTLGPKVIYSSLKQLGTLYSLDVSGSSTLNSVACTQVNCSGNVFGQDLVGTNVWADYVESSGYVVANTIEATNWVGLPSMPVDPTDLLPITLDSANGYVGINNVTPTRALDVVGNMHVTGISALSDVLATTVSATGDITADVLVANTTIQAPEADITGTVFCDTINAQHYVNLPVSDITPITLDKVNTRVGINKTTPAFTLDVEGDFHVSGNTYLSGNATCMGTVTADTISAQNYLNLPAPDILPITLDKTNIRVGINTTTPTNTLDVNGTSIFRGGMSQQSGTCSLQSTTVTNLFLRAGGSSDANNLFYLSQSGNYMYIDARSSTGSLAAAGISLRTSAVGSNVMSEALRLEGDMTARFYGNIIQTTTKTATLGGTSTTFLNTGSIRVNSLGSIISTNGTPEGVTTATVGSLYLRGDGADGTTLYTKVSGTGNTGWKPVMTDILPITLDKTNNRVGINQSTPTHSLDVVGNARITSDLSVDGTTLVVDSATHSVSINGSLVKAGTGTPEAVVIAPVGSLFMRSDGTAGTTLYTKESGTGNTGWKAVGGISPGDVGSWTYYANPTILTNQALNANTTGFWQFTTISIPAKTAVLLTFELYITKIGTFATNRVDIPVLAGSSNGVVGYHGSDMRVVRADINPVSFYSNTLDASIVSQNQSVCIHHTQMIRNVLDTPFDMYLGVYLASSTAALPASTWRINANDCYYQMQVIRKL